MQRDHAIDYLKGLLVIGMVYAHVLQFFSDRDFFPSMIYLTEFFNLITFSGFVFCFGYVCQIAYYRKPFQKVYKNMLMTSLKLLIAFYISGFAFQIFIEQQPLSLATLMPILLLQLLPGWSEFLASFAMVILIGLLLFHAIVWITDRPKVLGFVLVLLLTLTFIRYDVIHSPYLALFLGTVHFPTFPVLQYMPFYLLGIYFAKQRIVFNWKIGLLSILGTMMLGGYLVMNQFVMPERFPPSFYWLVGPSLLLYLYYLMANALDKWVKGLGILRVMGKYVLFYLLMSNMLIFALSSEFHYFIVGPWKGLVITVFILAITTFFILLIDKRATQVGE